MVAAAAAAAAAVGEILEEPAGVSTQGPDLHNTPPSPLTTAQESEGGRVRAFPTALRLSITKNGQGQFHQRRKKLRETESQPRHAAAAAVAAAERNIEDNQPISLATTEFNSPPRTVRQKRPLDQNTPPRNKYKRRQLSPVTAAAAAAAQAAKKNTKDSRQICAATTEFNSPPRTVRQKRTLDENTPPRKDKYKKPRLSVGSPQRMPLTALSKEQPKRLPTVNLSTHDHQWSVQNNSAAAAAATAAALSAMRDGSNVGNPILPFYF